MRRGPALVQRLEDALLRRRARRQAPLEALAALLRSGPDDPARRLALCVELGLVRRARQALSESRNPCPLPLALQLAWLEGDFPTFDRLSAEPASPASLARAPQNLQNKCLTLLAARSPAQALRFLQAMPRRPLCAPAIAMRAGAGDTARAWGKAWPWRLHADYLLLDANQAPTAAEQLSLLNQYLVHHGLARLRLVDTARPPAVGNLATGQPTRRPVHVPVSVVIPAHDNEAHIRASVESMLRQTCAPQEIVVVDDASRDGTGAIVSTLASAHPCIRLIRLGNNRGAYFARNLGLAAARGEFVAFQDADDFAHPQRLEVALAPLLRHAQVHATTSRCVRLSDDGVFGEARAWPLTRWTPISLVVRREVAVQRIGGFEEDVRFGADSEYVARLRLLLGERHHRLLAQPLALFGQREGSLTTAQGTGFDAQARSGARIAYQEAWTERHLTALLGEATLFRPWSDEVTRTLADAEAPVPHANRRPPPLA